MLILPAIDLRGGQCVRLRQGDYGRETVYDADPEAVARRWVAQGARWLHVVDLDGAREGRPVNGPAVQAIVTAAGVPCQLGGGLRRAEDVVAVLAWGVRRVIIGTRAVEDPDWLAWLCRHHPGQVALGLDVRDGRVATAGWREVSQTTALDLVRRCAGWPLAAVVATDIRRDGMLEGPNLEALAELAAASTFPVIASGGVTTAEDVRRLAGLGLSGCIVGRALYEGRIALPEIIAIANDPESERRGAPATGPGSRVDEPGPGGQ